MALILLKVMQTAIGLIVHLQIVNAVDLGTVTRISGDFKIGALFDIHEAPAETSQPFHCGDIDPIYGIQTVEAAIKTVREINFNNGILKGVCLGLEVRDSCTSPAIAFQQTLAMVWQTKKQTNTSHHVMTKTEECDYHNSMEEDHRCNNGKVSMENQKTSSTDAVNCKKDSKYDRNSTVIGVIGPPHRTSTVDGLQNLLQLFHIPQITYSTILPEFPDKTQYTTLHHLAPNVEFLFKAIIDILRNFNWTYISLITADEIYGQQVIQNFRELASTSNICIAQEETVITSLSDIDREYKRVIQSIAESPKAKVIVCFCDGTIGRGLLKAIRKCDFTNRFTFIASTDWSQSVTEGYENEAWGSLSLRSSVIHYPEFDEYFCSLNPYKGEINAWLPELWQQRFNCTLNPWNDTADKEDNKTRKCTGREKLCDKHYIQDWKIHFVSLAIWAMAHALDDMLKNVCGKRYYGVCQNMYPFNTSLYLEHLNKTSFTYYNKTFSFHQDYAGIRFDITNYQKTGNLHKTLVGYWQNHLELSNKVQFRENKTVVSICSHACGQGHYKNVKPGGPEKKCCWACQPCGRYQIVSSDVLSCDDCPVGFVPDTNKTVCLPLPHEYLSWNEPIVIVSMILSLTGLIATFITLYVFIKFKTTPIVKASTQELSWIILVGMILMHMSVFPSVWKPSLVSCTLMRFVPGLGFHTICASLLTKTYRIARILAISKKKFPKMKYRFMSTKDLVVISCLLILFSVLVSITLLILYPPIPHLEYPSRDRAVLTCVTSSTTVFVKLAFDILFLSLCTLHAIKTRNVPENFNEAKFIGFAMYTTCVIWIAFLSIYFIDRTKMNLMSISVTLIAWIQLIFLFFPKLYVIFYKSKNNNTAVNMEDPLPMVEVGVTTANIDNALSASENRVDQMVVGHTTKSHSKVLKVSKSVQTDIELYFNSFETKLRSSTICKRRKSGKPG